jgi:hypothetical protein
MATQEGDSRRLSKAQQPLGSDHPIFQSPIPTEREIPFHITADVRAQLL